MEGSGSSAGKIDLPAGVTVGAGREASETDEQGQVVQGVKFPIKTKNGTATTIFIPYSELHDTAKVQALISQRVNAVMAISG